MTSGDPGADRILIDPLQGLVVALPAMTIVNEAGHIRVASSCDVTRIGYQSGVGVERRNTKTLIVERIELWRNAPESSMQQGQV